MVFPSARHDMFDLQRVVVEYCLWRFVVGDLHLRINRAKKKPDPLLGVCVVVLALAERRDDLVVRRPRKRVRGGR